ncbi:anti-sigma factor [Paenibacillus sp. QZ-Y1]|uniref:anti-sigma factor n=1 Tax=Paenibacillus sp. QZ-Y1 TaxID=3414511 RepID=UPI003F78B103
MLQSDLAPRHERAARVEEAAQAQPWQPQGRARARSSRAWRVVSAGLAAAALVLGVYAGQLQGQVSSLTATQDQLAQVQAQNEQLANQLAALQQPARSVRMGEAVKLSPATQDIVAEGLATIVIDDKGTHLVVQAEKLPQLQGNEAFQVWLIKGDSAQNAGTFLTHDGTGAVYYTLESSGYDTVAITLEPDAMGDQPRGSMVLAAKIEG